MESAVSTQPETQADTLSCPICTQPLGFTLSEERWAIMGHNNHFGHLYNDMVPRGLVFGVLSRQRRPTSALNLCRNTSTWTWCAGCMPSCTAGVTGPSGMRG
jgi:hypothetical protein